MGHGNEPKWVNCYTSYTRQTEGSDPVRTHKEYSVSESDSSELSTTSLSGGRASPDTSVFRHLSHPRFLRTPPSGFPGPDRTSDRSLPGVKDTETRIPGKQELAEVRFLDHTRFRSLTRLPLPTNLSSVRQITPSYQPCIVTSPEPKVRRMPPGHPSAQVPVLPKLGRD